MVDCLISIRLLHLINTRLFVVTHPPLITRAVTFDSEGARSRTRYLGYRKFLRDSIFDGFGANGAKQTGEKQQKVKKS